MNRNHNLAGALYLTLASAIFMISGYISNVVLGRVLGPKGYGIYGVLISFMTTLNIMQLAGVPQAVSKFTAERKYEDESILASGLRIQLVVTILLSAILFIASPYISIIFNEPSLTNYARAISFIFPFYGLFALYSGYFNGLHLFKRQAFMYIIYSISKLSLVILLAVKFGLYGAIAGFVISPLVALLFGFRLPQNSSLFSRRQLIMYSLPLIGFAVLSTLQLSIDLFSLKAIVADTKVAGYYTAAQNIALITYSGMIAISQILFPSVSRFVGAGQIQEVRQIISKSLRYLFLLLLPVAALLAATAPELIKLLFGSKYLPAITPLRILLVGYVLLTIFTLLANVLNGAGRAKTSMLIAAAGVFIGFAGCLLLIPYYGANGAAIGTLIGSCVSALFAVMATYKVFEFPFSYASLAKALVGSAIVMVGGLLIPFPILLLPLVYIFLGGLYVLAMHLMGEITLEERTRIRSLMPSWFLFISEK